jgi:hypothetical protein
VITKVLEDGCCLNYEAVKGQILDLLIRYNTLVIIRVLINWAPKPRASTCSAHLDCETIQIVEKLKPSLMKRFGIPALLHFSITDTFAYNGWGALEIKWLQHLQKEESQGMTIGTLEAASNGGTLITRSVRSTTPFVCKMPPRRP